MSLKRLSEDRSLQVAPNEPQLQRFDFYNDRGDKIGKVQDLIADDSTMKVRFLIVSQHQGLLHSRQIIIPIKDVILDTDAERVICTDCREETLNNYPTYEGGVLPDLAKRFAATFIPGTGEGSRTTGTTARTTPETTMADRDIVGDRDTLLGRKSTVNDQAPLTGTVGQTIAGMRDRETDEARIDVIEEELQVGKRDVPIGEAIIRKTVTEEQICEPVELRQERVEIERHPVNRPSDVAPGQGPMEVRMGLMGQEVVSSKTAFVREEIIVHRVSDVERRDVCGEVRKEHVEMPSEIGKTNMMAGGTDLAGDKVDMSPRTDSDELLRPDHMTEEPKDRPIF